MTLHVAIGESLKDSNTSTPEISDVYQYNTSYLCQGYPSLRQLRKCIITCCFLPLRGSQLNYIIIIIIPQENWQTMEMKSNTAYSFATDSMLTKYNVAYYSRSGNQENTAISVPQIPTSTDDNPASYCDIMITNDNSTTSEQTPDHHYDYIQIQ